MGKIVRLTESQFINVVKKIVKEATLGLEPALGRNQLFGNFHYNSGDHVPLKYKGGRFDSKTKQMVVDQIADFIQTTGTDKVLVKYYKNEMLPKFIEIKVGTDVTGTQAANDKVAKDRINYLLSLVIEALNKKSYDSLKGESFSPEIIRQFVTGKLIQSYKPTDVDRNLVDLSKLKGNQQERFGDIVIYSLKEVGNTPDELRNITKGLQSSQSTIFGWVYSTDIDEITKGISKLTSWSDIQDVSNLINMTNRYENLEDFLNSTIDDSDDQSTIFYYLRQAAKSQGKENMIQLRNGEFVIIL